ncbi:MAG: hypothetical protein HY292_08085 [Planctomycetes bacterium]|nr:hypothetical protein [Planctomycetota bacterium]
MMASWRLVLAGSLALVAGTALGPAAFAQPVHAQPGSILIFPLFDARPHKGTLISVTNTNQSTLHCANDRTQRQGDVDVLYTYIDGETCLEFNVTEHLTPGDTLTVFADQHNPESNFGWLWVDARDPVSGDPIDFDFLIGSAIIVDTDLDFLFSYTPYPFRGLPNGDSGPGTDACGREFTDVNEDSFADFDGVEYDFFPDELLLDQFFQENGPFADEVTLMSTEVQQTSVTLLTKNNREQSFSRSLTFDCWTRGPLGLISNVFGQLGGDPNELKTSQGQSLQTGWIRFRSNDPMLGVFMHNVTGTSLAGGRELQYIGTQTARLPRID